MRRGVVALGAGVLAVWAALYTFDVVARDPVASFSGTSALARVALVAAGWSLVAVGLGSWLRAPASRFGLLLATAGFGWFLLEWPSPGAGSARAFTIGLVFYAVCAPLVGHARLTYRSGRLSSRLERAVVALAYCAGVLLLGLVPALFYDPSVAGCGDCPRNLLLVGARPSTVDNLNLVGLSLAAVTGFLLALLLVRRLVGVSSAAPRADLIVLVAAAISVTLAGAIDAASIDRRLLWNGLLERRLWLGQAVALVALSLGVAWSWGRARRGRSAVARITLDLSRSPPPGGLRDALAEVVGDPKRGEVRRRPKKSTGLTWTPTTGGAMIGW